VQPFELQDCRDLKEPDNSWDVVIIQDCLEHTNGYEVPMAEALRVAKQRVVVTFWHLQEGEGHINDDGNDGYGAWYQRSEWEKFLDTLGYPWEWTNLVQGEGNRQRDYYIIDKEP
jgi:ubiquinone/menaquinone biosynthesis C-methylase UbiE